MYGGLFAYTPVTFLCCSYVFQVSIIGPVSYFDGIDVMMFLADLRYIMISLEFVNKLEMIYINLAEHRG